MTFYATKFSLTEGITLVRSKEPENGMLIDQHHGLTSYYHGEGREWHRTFARAKERAEAMRVRKIASLKKQISKLEQLRFSEPQA